MKIKTVVCDIDGTLMPIGGGICVHKEVEQALMQLQETGVRLILSSARSFQGVYPLAKQLQMERYGGIIIACNGTYAYDCQKQLPLFVHEIKKDDALSMAETVNGYGAAYAIAQNECMIATGFPHGFSLDQESCDIPYLITKHMEHYIKDPIIKCAVSADKECIDQFFPSLKKQIEETYPYDVIRSIDIYIDIIARGYDKATALQECQDLSLLTLDTTAAIGDSHSDLCMLEQCAFSATLQNGKEACKACADLIVDDCEQNGSIAFFQAIMKRNQAI